MSYLAFSLVHWLLASEVFEVLVYLGLVCYAQLSCFYWMKVKVKKDETGGLLEFWEQRSAFEGSSFSMDSVRALFSSRGYP